MSVKVKVLSSGSAGNSTFVGTERTRVLIDAGISRKAVESGLREIGEDPADIDAVILTHAHGDHTSGILGLVGAYQMPVYLTPGTEAVLGPVLRRANALTCNVWAPNGLLQLADFMVLPVNVPHDCAEPAAYALLAEGVRLGFVTDVGHVTDSMREVFRDVDWLLLESNHDVDGLRASAYPAKHKVRVRENHLNNDQVSAFIREHMDPCVRHLVLGHVSASNNDCALVRALAQRSLQQCNRSTRLSVIPPGGCSEVFTL